MIRWFDEIGVYQSAVNIGVIKHQNSTLIDTGIDNNSINKVIKNINTINSVFITHHHADHCGGIAKLQKIGIENIYGPPGELALISQSIIEPYTIYGGYPSKILQNKYLMAKSATIKPNTDSTEVQSISTPGHTIDHYCYQYSDAIYGGDLAFTADTIDKYKLLFAINPDKAKKSCENIKNHKFSLFIPAHGPIQESRQDALAMINATIQHYENIEKEIKDLIDECTYSEFTTIVMKSLELTDIIKKIGVNQFFLYEHTIKGYLSNLLDKKEVSFNISSGQLIIQKN